jgi:hypothetical protein
MCPSCREEVTEDYARASATKLVLNTQACSLANTIKSAEPAVVIVLCASLLGFFFVDPGLLIVNLFTPVIYLAAILLWLRYYRKFWIGDDEFQRARARMWSSLRLWIALWLAQLLALIYLWRSAF